MISATIVRMVTFQPDRVPKSIERPIDMESYPLSISVLMFFVMLALMCRFLMGKGPACQPPQEPADDEDTIILEPGQVPFADFARVLRDDEVTNIASVIVATLAAQKAFASVHADGLPEKARDNFSIGYVGGYLGEVLRRKHMEATNTVQAIEQVVFTGIFGSAEGDQLHQKFLSLRHSDDPAVAAGIAAGATDIKEWLKNDFNVPFGWSLYVHDCPDTV